MYTALDAVRKKNRERYGIDGPVVPESVLDVRIKNNEGKKGEFKFVKVSELEEHALHFIREMCEELRFDKNHSDLEDREGTSLKKGQIPINMEKDIDRLCLESAIHRFMESGVAEDAFDIYYIFLEMFIGKYSKSKKMIEKLSEFESNASALLMSHRDHYSHSVYVFLIGLAIYDSSESYRKKYNNMYGLEGKEAAHHFLKFWGLSSLFHDIGYPFELPFEEIMSYFDKTKGAIPYITYRNMDQYIKLEGEDIDKALKLTGGIPVENMADLLTLSINKYLGEHYKDRLHVDLPGMNGDEGYLDYLKKVFEWKPKDTAVFGNPGRPLGYMDHAYFSAMLLMRNLFDILTVSELNTSYTDVLTAIVLHNSIFKHVIQNQKSKDKSFDLEKHAIHADWHPLAYLLMLCDELQCWDRASYGQTSRTEVHAMACDFVFDNDSIIATYKFDKAMEEKANRKNANGEFSVGGTYKKMIKKCADGTIKFQRDIEEIVAINREDELSLEVRYEFTDDIKYRKTFLSQSNFMHLYDFAVILSGRKKFSITDADKDDELRSKMEESFEMKSLEYKIIDIERVKKFAKYLDAINCFYTDRAVAYPLLTEFTEGDMDIIGPMEHERWLWIHHVMGWKYDNKYLEFKKEEQGEIRELTRTHSLMLESGDYTYENAIKHYMLLPDSEKDKDTEPMNKLLYLLSMLDGVKFYRLIFEE